MGTVKFKEWDQVMITGNSDLTHYLKEGTIATVKRQYKSRHYGTCVDVIGIHEDNGKELAQTVSVADVSAIEPVEFSESDRELIGIEETLEERGNRYGAFDEHARITQNIKAAMVDSKNWEELEDDQKESLEMIAHKIGRILNGDPDYDDSWVDLSGYATLIANRLTLKCMS